MKYLDITKKYKKKTDYTEFTCKHKKRNIWRLEVHK